MKKYHIVHSSADLKNRSSGLFHSARSDKKDDALKNSSSAPSVDDLVEPKYGINYDKK